MEFTKEEKKAIERIKLFEYRYTLVQNDDKVVEVIINLIEKQQKEIERLKKDNIQVIYGGRRFGTEGMVVKDYISKDKIREIIKELENRYKNGKIKQQRYYDAVILLDELLEENTNE